MRRHICVAILSMWPAALLASHHSITLKDGNVYRGVFVSGDSRVITFQDEQGVRRRFDVENVRSLDFGDSGTSSSAVVPDERPLSRSRGMASREADRVSDYRNIPAGSELQIRTNETIEARTASEGRSYSAEVYKDVTDSSGAVLIPRGSNAQLVVRRAAAGGATGSPELTLDLQSVEVNGRRYLVSTQDVERSNERGLGRNRRTAEMVGGGAALGTVIGAIAGGGKGAAIGALAGAAAGATAQVLTKGKEIKVPAESVLTFRLDQPVRLEAMR